MMLSISVTAFAQDTSSDCDKEYYDRYGRWMENHLVTWWGVPPVLMRSSGKYAAVSYTHLTLPTILRV